MRIVIALATVVFWIAGGELVITEQDGKNGTLENSHVIFRRVDDEKRKVQTNWN